MRPSAGDEIAARYRLLRRIGAGGMGEVWVARHLELDLEMAVKLIAPERDGSDTAERRFRREAQAAAKLKSPYIATIHDFGRSGGHLFLVMELLEGRDLSAYLKSGPMDPPEALFVVDQLCRALSVIHEGAVIHRDLKPSNIFLAEQGEEVTTKILDFGIAKSYGEREGDETQTTETGVRIGSPGYMSPEQLFGEKVTPRSDLWTLGCVAYEMLAGARPFYGAAPGRLYAEVVAGNVRPLTLGGGTAGEVTEVFRRALSVEAEARFAQASEFFVALREALGEPKLVMPRRRQNPVGQGAAATVTLTTPSEAGANDAYGVGSDEASQTADASTPGDVVRPSGAEEPTSQPSGDALMVDAVSGEAMVHAASEDSARDEAARDSAGTHTKAVVASFAPSPFRRLGAVAAVAAAMAIGAMVWRASPAKEVDTVALPAAPVVALPTATARPAMGTPSRAGSIPPAGSASPSSHPAPPQSSPPKPAVSQNDRRAAERPLPPAPVAPPPAPSVDPFSGLPVPK